MSNHDDRPDDIVGQSVTEMSPVAKGSGAAASGTASATVWLICLVTKIPDVSRLGYTFRWRLDYLTRIDPAIRAATVARISR